MRNTKHTVVQEQCNEHAHEQEKNMTREDSDLLVVTKTPVTQSGHSGPTYLPDAVTA